MGPLQVGTTLSRKYKIERLLAESGGAVLYEATDTSRAQRVWIKIMQRESLGNAVAMARFQREAAGSKVLDVGKNDAGLPYMVATEFGPPEKPAMPPRPKSSRTTLKGVAPPPGQKSSQPPREEVVEIEEAAPLSGRDFVLDATPAPPPAAAGIFSAPAADANPVLASPLVTTPPPTFERLPDPPPDQPILIEAPITELPSATPSEPTLQRRRPQSATPTVLIDRPRERSQTGVWIVALVLASIVTGGAGWYFGHKDARGPQPVATSQTTMTQTTMTTSTAQATATATATATPAAATTVAAATTTSEAPPASTTVAVATTTAPPPATTAPPPRRPAPPVRRPVSTAKPVSGDPLTL